MLSLTRRGLTAIAAALFVSGAALAQNATTLSQAEAGQVRATDRVMGEADAPVTFIEYGSVACSHCAHFQEVGFPAVREAIDAGDVRFVFREMITGQPNIAIAGFALANCAPDNQYFEVIDAMFLNMRSIYEAMQTGEALDRYNEIASEFGFSPEDVQACFSNEQAVIAVQEHNRQAAEDGVRSTPYFIINGDHLIAEENGSGEGYVYTVNGQPLADSQGVIPADHEAATVRRIIALYKGE
ncbi:thioredoxin domain-containing protein [Oceanicaulis sp. LC35]|uniref:thioredoxin domain-containing protein n=1 Tax=Oceanicaulis sp. LC35 TaxID=3349635 RepID=UPI003F85C0AE